VSFRLTQNGGKRLTQDGGRRLLQGDAVVLYRPRFRAKRFTGPSPDVAAHFLGMSRMDKFPGVTRTTPLFYLSGGGGIETSWQGGTVTNPNVGGDSLRLCTDRPSHRRRWVSFPVNWSWGNDDWQDSMDSMVAYAEANYGFEPPYHLLCASMGAACGFNWAANNLDKVKAIAGLIPALDIQEIVDDSLVGTPPVPGPPTVIPPDDAQAYGTRPPNSHNPADNAHLFNGVIPIKLWYSNNDAICKPANVAPFVSASGATAVNCGNQTGFIGIPGHNLAHSTTSPDPFNAIDVADFFAQHD
jgi:hypothetical protein